jgi:excisionase family DNA binding protein
MKSKQADGDTLHVTARLLDVFDIAEHFNVHYRTAQRWTKKKWIPYYRVGKSVRYDLTKVLAAVSSSAS